MKAAKSPAKNKSAPSAKDGRTGAWLTELLALGHIQATESKQGTRTKQFKWLSSAQWPGHYLHFLGNRGVLLFLPNYISAW